MENQPTLADNTLKMYAATAMAQTLSFSMERKYLDNIGKEDLNPLFKMHEVDVTAKADVAWIEISQIGKPINDDVNNFRFNFSHFVVCFIRLILHFLADFCT